MNNRGLRFNLADQINDLGLELDVMTGHLRYARSFTPLEINSEVIIVRHGETYGNCGQITMDAKIDTEAVERNQKDKMRRVFQGNVDTEINQLTTLGHEQAKQAAVELEHDYIASGWFPDIIFHSPLNRARETGLYFVMNNHYENRYFSHHDIRELSFGAWENKRICDLPDNHRAHSFYLDQNAMVVESGINNNGDYQKGECFADIIITAHQFLQKLHTDYPHKRIILFSHSMFGAACCILFGKGRNFENSNYLAFDGKDSQGRDYCLPHATPIALNFSIPKLTDNPCLSFAHLY